MRTLAGLDYCSTKRYAELRRKLLEVVKDVLRRLDEREALKGADEVLEDRTIKREFFRQEIDAFSGVPGDFGFHVDRGDPRTPSRNRARRKLPHKLQCVAWSPTRVLCQEVHPLASFMAAWKADVCAFEELGEVARRIGRAKTTEHNSLNIRLLWRKAMD
ncbi:MAG: hypothetical protein IPN32_07870 [Deltaproteobacteria bacterium]|nr:hypothetical protein [Deltaproteobacteria bacterium]